MSQSYKLVLKINLVSPNFLTGGLLQRIYYELN